MATLPHVSYLARAPYKLHPRHSKLQSCCRVLIGSVSILCSKVRELLVLCCCNLVGLRSCCQGQAPQAQCAGWIAPQQPLAQALCSELVKAKQLQLRQGPQLLLLLGCEACGSARGMALTRSGVLCFE